MWYGGGCDLTPSYLFEDDAVEFHAFWRALCDAHRPGLYAEYKAWCDRWERGWGGGGVGIAQLQRFHLPQLPLSFISILMPALQILLPASTPGAPRCVGGAPSGACAWGRSACAAGGRLILLHMKQRPLASARCKALPFVVLVAHVV